MTPTTIAELQARANHLPAGNLLDELHQAYDKLRQLAEALQAREKALEAREKEMAELLALKKIAYRFMAEDAIRHLPPLPEDVDLEKWAREQGGQPLEDFIDDL